eukprot:TRINITY_DN19093_c0_g1_i1.p2 TRINITY_DN19093_c0_g1~~TRINITY_DN19093_c0_g1_i1.p2  ORF type:complete len:183 (+),score=77.44 TRINITY_DN19093_c0_g1_i1:58-549(+)
MADPVTMTSIANVGHPVEITFTDAKHCKAAALRGLLWNVDPETGCCVVIHMKGGVPAVATAFAHGIAAVTRMDTDGRQVEGYAALQAAAARLRERVHAGAGAGGKTTADVTAALTKARLPHKVVDGGVVSVLDGAALVRPPYAAANISCTNDQILRKLIEMLQ